jgi:hypothetical protein
MMVHVVPKVKVVMVPVVPIVKVVVVPVTIPVPVMTMIAPAVPVMVMPHHMAPAFRPDGGRLIRALGRGRCVGRCLGERRRRSDASRDSGGCQ